jgi:hypothetical protein
MVGGSYTPHCLCGDFDALSGHWLPLLLDQLNVIGQFQDTRADERLRRVSAVGFLHVSGWEIPQVAVTPDWHLACTVRANGRSAVNYLQHINQMGIFLRFFQLAS